MKRLTLGTPEKLVPSVFCKNFRYEETEISARDKAALDSAKAALDSARTRSLDSDKKAALELAKAKNHNKIF